jgi:hypothetical protein
MMGMTLRPAWPAWRQPPEKPERVNPKAAAAVPDLVMTGR